MSDSLHSYYVRLDKALRKHEPFISSNTDIFHASAIVTCVYAHAQDKIRLLTRDFDNALYCSEHKLDMLREFFDRGGKLEVLVEEELPADHGIWTIAASYRDNLSLKKSPPSENLKFNFLIADDAGFRYESDKWQRKALVCFHAEVRWEFQNRLTGFHDRLSARSATIAIP